MSKKTFFSPRPIAPWLVLLLILPLAASETRPAPTLLSLADALQKGLENNFRIRVARESAQIAANNNNWGAAGAYPTLTAGLNFNNSYKDEPNASTPGERKQYMQHALSPLINLRWTLFNGFAVSIGKERLEYLNRLSEGNAAIVVENTIQAIVLSYYKSLLEKEKEKAAEEILAVSSDRLNYTETRQEVGAAGTYDLLQARIAFLSDTAILLQQRMNTRNAHRNLNLVMGEPAENEYLLNEPFIADFHEYDLPQLLEKMTANNKTLLNQYINQEILKKETGIARSAAYPLAALNSGVTRLASRLGYENLPAIDNVNYDYYVNFSISLNLFNGGNTRRAIANAKIQENIGRLQKKEMEFALSNQLRGNFELYTVRKQLLTVAEERLKSAKLSLEISNDKFKAGTINSFNYREVQTLYLNAAFGRLQAVYDLIETHAELMRLTGGVISEY